MNGHGINAACMYVSDFKNWYIKSDLLKDIKVYVNDRFSAYSEQQQNELYNIFSKLADKISSQENEKDEIDTSDIVSELIEFLNK